MNAVNLQPDTYRSVEIYAKHRHLSVDDVVNGIIDRFISSLNPALTVHDNLKNDLTDFLSLKGVLKDSSTSQSDRDLIDDYLKEKYKL